MPLTVRKKTILVVDTERRTRSSVKRALQNPGYRVLEAASALEAFLVAARPRSRIDLLLTEIEMPGINGLQLAEKFAQPFPNTPVIFLCRNGATAPGVRLVKPVAAEVLVHQVRGLLEPAPKKHPCSESAERTDQNESKPA